MKVRELIDELQKYNPNAEVKLCGYLAYSDDPNEKNDYIDFNPGYVHNLWFNKIKGDMVSIEFQRGCVDDADGTS